MFNIWPKVAWTEALDKQWSNRIARRGETRGRASAAKRATSPRMPYSIMSSGRPF